MLSTCYPFPMARGGTTKSDPNAAGQLIFEVLRLHGRLIAAGDMMTADLGLTSARWQVLGTIVFLERPQTVAGLARNLGLTRQSVQRVINDLVREGLLTLHANPEHKRARLILLTDRGREVYAAAERRRIPWTEAIADGLADYDVEAACACLMALRQILDRKT